MHWKPSHTGPERKFSRFVRRTEWRMMWQWNFEKSCNLLRDARRSPSSRLVEDPSDHLSSDNKIASAFAHTCCQHNIMIMDLMKWSCSQNHQYDSNGYSSCILSQLENPHNLHKSTEMDRFLRTVSNRGFL
jgi:hypothetical protein